MIFLRHAQHTSAILVMALLLSTVGCGGKLDSSVSGTVTLDGKPIQPDSGAVSFYPTNGGPAAQASIDPDGSYAVRTGSSAGLPAGDYLVTVVASGPGPKLPPGEPVIPGPLLTPIRYGNRQKTDLKFTVRPGANQIDIPLTSQK